MFEQILAALAALQNQVVELQDNALASEQAKYDEGYAAGLVAGGADKIYSQAEVDAIVLPLNENIAALEVLIADINTSIPVKVAEAVATFKAELLAKYEEQQVVESASETGFKNLLV